jgi:hypothetical protein
MIVEAQHRGVWNHAVSLMCYVVPPRTLTQLLRTVTLGCYHVLTRDPSRTLHRVHPQSVNIYFSASSQWSTAHWTTLASRSPVGVAAG